MAHHWRSRKKLRAGDIYPRRSAAGNPRRDHPNLDNGALDKTPVFGKNHTQAKIRGDDDGCGYDDHGGGAARSAAPPPLHAENDNGIVAWGVGCVLLTVLLL